MWTKPLLATTASLAYFLSFTSAQTPNTNAPITTDNHGKLYRAELQPKDNTTVGGHVTTYSGPSKVGINFDIEFWGIPTDGQPLAYHIHEKPVPEDGNCYSTGAHLDPYKRGDTIPCDIKAPETCQVGDLSGKHGPVWAPEDETFSVTYTDWFVSNVVGDVSFFGNLSVVVHASDNSRLACGNFELFDFSH
ncbi:Cu,Zn superoxide dismutase-like protein [Aspergillus sclerotioniger CBS 115572]|uniref:superoxide dismutase n=1 Tax=Aspergillus sclerotioniger CBS 115572 TaxID=1450535 RepID=A0A317VJL9_9EURO|nr:Cu,Zn superoxide dismutase-like protein [Aspergillus sclerotioniger CBS 115572]PWY73208.1 Cu,Zn superoxide dismutase-like protein [Aspergillus sclerotioniger CBS 115572]